MVLNGLVIENFMIKKRGYRISFYKECKRKTCQNRFKAYPTVHKNTSYLYCSQGCYHTDTRKQSERKCERCGIMYTPINHKKGGNHFCSFECFKIPLDLKEVARLYWKEMLSIKEISKMLGLSYTKIYWAMTKGNIPKRSNFSASFKGGRPFNYINGEAQGRRNKLKDRRKEKTWREAVFKRDGYTCVRCGTKERIEADHIQRWSLFPALRYEITNGQTLCRECHKQKTRQENKLYWVNQYKSALASASP